MKQIPFAISISVKSVEVKNAFAVVAPLIAGPHLRRVTWPHPVSQTRYSSKPKKHLSSYKRLTVVRDGGPLIQLAFVGPGIKAAALDVPKRGPVCRAGLHVADPVALPFPQAISPTILWPEVRREKHTNSPGSS